MNGNADILSLYRRSFPPSERRSDDAILVAMASPKYRLLTHQIDGDLAGFALIFQPPGETFALLEYLAVDPEFQRRGIGSRLIGEAIEANHGRRLLFEVEAQSLGESAKLRQRFYRRCGCRHIIGLNYLLPLPNDPPPMELMVYAPGVTTICCDNIRHDLRLIYRDVYGQPGDDPRIETMLSGGTEHTQKERFQIE